MGEPREITVEVGFDYKWRNVDVVLNGEVMDTVPVLHGMRVKDVAGSPKLRMRKIRVPRKTKKMMKKACPVYAGRRMSPMAMIAVWNAWVGQRFVK